MARPPLAPPPRRWLVIERGVAQVLEEPEGDPAAHAAIDFCRQLLEQSEDAHPAVLATLPAPTDRDLATGVMAALYGEVRRWRHDPGQVAGERRGVAARAILECARFRRPRLSLAGLSLSALPACIGTLDHLRELNLSMNELGDLPPGIGRLRRLETLRIDTDVDLRNATMGFPACIAELVSLQRLSMQSQGIRALPESMQQLRQLRHLDLSDNQLEVPHFIGAFENLRTLWLNGNQLETLPATMGNLQQLRELHLEDNALVTLPVTLGNLQQLETLHLEENPLMSLPATLGNLQRLRHLHLEHTNLTELPASILDLHDACMVYLHENPLDLRWVEATQAALSRQRGPRIEFNLAANAPVVDQRPLEQAVNAWLVEANGANPGSSTDAAMSTWRTIGSAESAGNFGVFLDRLRETADYRNPMTRPSFTRRMAELLGTLEDDQTLRQLCFNVADDALSSCGDRVALAFANMEDAVDNHRAVQRGGSDADLLSVCSRRFRRDSLSVVAREKMSSIQMVDEVEVELAYRVGLATLLDLGDGLKSMLYFSVSGVSQEDLERARQQVRESEQGPALIEFLAADGAWWQHLERTRPEAFAPLRREMERRRDELVIMPETMREQEYLERLAAVDRDEAASLQAICTELTQGVLELVRRTNSR